MPRLMQDGFSTNKLTELQSAVFLCIKSERNVYSCTDILLCNWGLMKLTMDELQLTGRNLGRVFNSRHGHLHSEDLWCYNQLDCLT